MALLGLCFCVGVSQLTLDVSPWRLHERLEAIRVDDDCFAGAVLGLAASHLHLSGGGHDCFGMMNTGACTGAIGGHGNLRHTGEQQNAYRALVDA